MSALYWAVIGDMVRSREVADRDQLQERLRRVLQRVNDAFADGIASVFIITTGDEFQGLLSTPKSLDRLLAMLRAGLHPQEVRFGLGLGGLDTTLQPQAIGMDGPCFHHARNAIERAEARGTPIETSIGRWQSAFEIYSVLYGEMRSGWTQKQRRVVDLAAQGVEGVEIAAQLQISPSAVSQHLHAAGFPAVSYATQVWQSEIESLHLAQLSSTEGVS